jgi:hypothetical protein
VAIGVFDLLTVGIGPPSSHTVDTGTFREWASAVRDSGRIGLRGKHEVSLRRGRPDPPSPHQPAVPSQRDAVLNRARDQVLRSAVARAN